MYYSENRPNCNWTVLKNEQVEISLELDSETKFPEGPKLCGNKYKNEHLRTVDVIFLNS